MTLEEKINISRQAAIIAGVFTAIVSLLMLLNYLQIRSSEPLDSMALTILVERLSAEPDNQVLVEEIRQLDLLARKAYFTSIWQIRTGAWLLIIGAVVLVVALRMYFSLRFSIDQPSHENIKEKPTRLISERWIAIAGAVVIGLAVLSAIFSADYLKQYETRALLTDQADDTVEQVDIVRRTERAGEVVTRPDNGETEEQAVDPLPETQEVAEAEPEVTEAVAIRRLTAEAVHLNHNAFRGAWGNGVSHRRNTPVEWDGESGLHIKWKTNIPLHGYNSPVLWGDRLFLSGADQSKRVVYCVDRHSGRMLWEREVSNIAGSPATPPRTTDDTGLAAPSLTADTHRVFAIFGTGDIIAFDHDGNRLWARNLGVPANHYGHSSSLLTWDEKVFVQYDTQDGASVMALDASTGDTRWETRRSGGVSWASPLLVRTGGEFMLILSTNPNVAAYDIQTGEEIWSVNCMSGEVGPSPAYGGGLVYAANEYAKLVAINPANGDIVWEDNYYLPEVASPLYHNGLLYIATSYAVFACFDATDGTFLWEFDADDGFYSSPMLVDGMIYIFDMGGKAYVFRPGREMELIASPSLGERVYATPVFSDRHLYIRANRHLFGIGQ